MKKPFVLICLMLAASFSSAQNFEGTWRGVMVQDSPVTRINFEMVLEKKEGKIIGYLYRLFIVDDSLIYNTVKVNARVSDNVLIIEDDESVSRNFEERANRKIKAAYFFKLNTAAKETDSLTGEWTTSRFRNKYMSISGRVAVKKEPDYQTTQLFKRLEEKQLQNSIAFVPKLSSPDVAVKTSGIKPAPSAITVEDQKKTNTGSIKDTVQTTVAVNQPEIQIQQPVIKKEKPTNETRVAEISSNKPITTPAPSTEPKKDTVQNAIVKNQSKTQAPPPVTQPSIQQKPVTRPSVKNDPKPVAVTPPAVITTTPAEQTQAQIIKTDAAVIKETGNNQTTTKALPPVINNPVITSRTTEMLQTLEIVEDSAVLALYDNGEIDGDIVSAYINNEKIIDNVYLKASAYKKTIYFKEGETVQLTLFAENLGSIPPNTGLLIITSGEKRYQIFFSSTLNKNSAILLKRE